MSVNLRYFYRWSHDGLDRYGNTPLLLMARNINGLPIGDPHPFYILSGAISDFSEHSPQNAVHVLNQIKRLERGEISTYQWEGDGFIHQMTSTKVTFEHAIFGECPEWPIWSCTLAQYKAALLGWKQFLQMPKNIDSELTVELPDAAA